MNPGTIVRCRGRDWVLLPGDQEEVALLRPLTGATDEVVAVHKQLANLIGSTLPEERIRPATFPLPNTSQIADAAGARLLWQAARLSLREGAAPLRSLGRISIRPRVYQFVPLLMALRLDPVRMLIADDVGVGKTIEALLIARELYDRGEIKRLCVLCPPYLCEQWQQELASKFNLEAVIIRSGTVAQLERQRGGSESIYRYYPVQVASIDFLKSDRNKHQFLLHCPDLIIVDEAHGAAAQGNLGQQQRHRLLREIAALTDRHLILLTATPHSGIETAFRSLLGLIDPEFDAWDTSDLTDAQRARIARHFVQRTRRDIEHDWDGERCFPRREFLDLSYRLSRAYRELFDEAYDFCAEIVQAGRTLDARRRRVHYWGALALLRCIMSSPAAALAALEKRQQRAGGAEIAREAEDDADFRRSVFESDSDRTDDEQPTHSIEEVEAGLPASERRKLRKLAKLAAALHEPGQDTKLEGLIAFVTDLLGQGSHPIIWCRYVATAEYVAKALQNRLAEQGVAAQVICITGRQADDERRARIAEIDPARLRVLVATDCLSEGINLQEHFDAVLHYDLPWNPNRLEQREGRVDRYGQNAPVVKAIRYFSPDNPVDGVLLDVLLNKAREIHKALGTHVPVPDDSETVTEAVLNALFLRGRRPNSDQLTLDLGLDDAPVRSLHHRWERDAERERLNRTKFAQRALKPEAVRKELEAVDGVLGDPDAVRQFVLTAGQRLGLPIVRDRRADVFRVAVTSAAAGALPPAVQFALPRVRGDWLITFASPSPEGAEYVGRNHPFVAALARFLMEEAITRPGAATAARCGALRTRAVARRTVVLLIRVRYLIHSAAPAPLLSEEVRVVGYVPDSAGQPDWLAPEAALRLLEDAQPDANLAMPEKRALVEAALDAWPSLEAPLRAQLDARAAELERSHARIRQSVGLRARALRVEPQWPPDLLALLVLESC
ncbi:MAG: DEAD/DEAH box helicase [Thermoflexales bacterium]|nr:DEAD/DEAH box helicase [Thermoflexales bacterium]